MNTPKWESVPIVANSHPPVLLTSISEEHFIELEFLPGNKAAVHFWAVCPLGRFNTMPGKQTFDIAPHNHGAIETFRRWKQQPKPNSR